MSKPTLASVVATKGAATPPAIQERNLETKEPSKEEKKEVPTQQAARKHPWDGQDDIIKANYEVPRRIQTKLHTLKTWGRVKNIKGFVADALEAALDKEIAKAEREGY